MIENIGPGNLRVAFQGEKPFSISETGKIFTLIEEIYVKFSKQIFENDDFCLHINSIKPELAAFDLISSTIDCKPVKHRDFEEITICFLYSFYSSSMENDLELFDENSKNIHNSVTGLINSIKEGQILVLASSIDDKCIKISIQNNNNIKLEKLDTKPIKFEFNNKEQIIKVYNENPQNAFNGCNIDQFDISDIDLSGASFCSASLFEVKLNNSNLTNIDFTDSDVSNASITNSDLSNCILNEADFSATNLSKSNLKEASLLNADLSSSNLEETMLDSVNIEGTDFSSAHLSKAIFKGDIKFNSDTDFSNNANWWDANIEHPALLEWLENTYPKK